MRLGIALARPFSDSWYFQGPWCWLGLPTEVKSRTARWVFGVSLIRAQSDLAAPSSDRGAFASSPAVSWEASSVIDSRSPLTESLQVRKQTASAWSLSSNSLAAGEDMQRLMKALRFSPLSGLG